MLAQMATVQDPEVSRILAASCRSLLAVRRQPWLPVHRLALMHTCPSLPVLRQARL